MTTRLQIARARARVALAARMGEELPDSVHELAEMDFADADQTAGAGRGRCNRQRPLQGDLHRCRVFTPLVTTSGAHESWSTRGTARG